VSTSRRWLLAADAMGPNAATRLNVQPPPRPAGPLLPDGAPLIYGREIHHVWITRIDRRRSLRGWGFDVSAGWFGRGVVSALSGEQRFYARVQTAARRPT
jgi:hypothetical protein